MGVAVQTIAVSRLRPGREPASLPAVPTGVFSRDGAQTFDTAIAPAPWVRLAAEALRAERLALAGEPVLIRHRPGDHGLPPAAAGAVYRFAMDLTDARTSLTGGVLLFLDETGKGSGWRAEAGALTLWSGADPELTELVPGAPERLTLIGQARALSPAA